MKTFEIWANEEGSVEEIDTEDKNYATKTEAYLIEGFVKSGATIRGI